MNTRHRPCEPDTKRGKQRVDIVIITVPSGSLTTTLPLRNECIHVAAHTTWYARIHPDGTLLRQSWKMQLTWVLLCAVHRTGFKTASRGKRRTTVTCRFQFDNDVREVSTSLMQLMIFSCPRVLPPAHSFFPCRAVKGV